MDDRIEIFLNCNDVLKRKIKIFIEYFVKYYGEDKRQEIEDKLSKALYIGYMTPDRRKSVLNQLKKRESLRLQDVVVKKTTLPLSRKELYDDSEFEFYNIMPIRYLCELKDEYEKGKKLRLREFNEEGYEYVKRFYKDLTKIKFMMLKSADDIPRELPDFIRDNINYYLNKDNAESDFEKLFTKALPILKKINPNVTIDNLDTIFKRKDVLELIESNNEALQQYALFKQDQKEHFESDEKAEQLKSLLSTKYYILYIKDNIDLIPEEHRDTLYKYLEGKSKDFYPNSYMSKILGFSLNINSTSLLEYFDEESDLALTDEKMEWKAKYIKENRIEYFNLLGIDLGDDYEAYVNNPECQAIWPSKSTIKRVVESRKHYVNKFNNEFFLSISEFREIREKIDKLDLLDKEDSFNATLLTDSGTFINPNIRLTEQGYEAFSLFVISFNDLKTDCLDHHIIHELNHLYEIMLTRLNGNEYELVCGWDLSTGTINNEQVAEVDTINTKREKRGYELFNEIINELLAQGICELMHNDGVVVFDEPGNSRYKHTTSYEDYSVLVKQFFEEYKDIIIESRRDGNIDVIYNAVGKENFEALNELIQEFYSHFNGMKIYSLKGALVRKEDTELTRIYFDLLDRRDIILENMKNYKNEHKMTM